MCELTTNPSPDAVTIHTDRDFRDRMIALAAHHGRSPGHQLAVWIEDAEHASAEEAEEREWWADVFASVQRLKADPEAWADYVAELDAVDGLGHAGARSPGHQLATAAPA